ncbi:MAG: hypothetical protein GY725_17140 [bacterium]|nr:hypothetical protein [bacterium]
MYAGIVVWFASNDIYQERFYQPGGFSYLTYSVLRALFIGYLMALLYGLGSLVLAIPERRRRLPLTSLDRFILGFYLGSAVLHIAFQFLGYAGLYERKMMIALSLPLVAISFPGVFEFWRHRGAITPRLPTPADGGSPSRALTIGRAALLASVGLAGLYLIVVKGLQPHSVSDVATHYFPYYRRVVETQGIWPNELWYHYYHTKGAGAVFLSLLLTDLIGAQLATCSFVLVSALVVFSLVRTAIGSRWWGLMAVALYLTGMLDQWSWASFEKQHIMMMALLAGLVWMVVRLDAAGARDRRLWAFCTALMIMSLVIFVPSVFPFAAGLLGLMGLRALFQQRQGVFIACAAAGLAGGLVLLGNFAFNQSVTGMADIVPFRIFWELADQQKLSSWVSPYLMLLMTEGSPPGFGGVHPIEIPGSVWEYWHEVFRLKSVRALCAHEYLALPLLATSALISRHQATPAALRRVAAALASLAIVAFGLGHIVNQPTSMLRFYAFTLFLVVVGLSIAWQPIWQRMSNLRARDFLSYGLPALVAVFAFLSEAKQLGPRRIETGLRFVSGTLSFADVYEQDRSLWRPAERLARTLEPNARVWSLNGPYHLSMAPSPRIEGFLSFGMSLKYEEVLFESPKRARSLLREAGLDYFLVDTSRPLFDVLPHAELFRPENIGDWLSVAWREDDAWVFSWSQPGSAPIPEEFLSSYARMVEEAQENADWRGLHGRLENIYRRSGGSYPLKVDRAAPAIRGFQ